jgi:predicted nicotinamide N-methyase
VSAPLDLVEETVRVAGRDLSLLRPRDPEALLDEEAFEHEEFLPYWAELWPSSLALAAELAGRALRGTRVLELGCGLAVPSIVAALDGAEVLATDWSPDAVALAGRNAERNGAILSTALVGWASPQPLLEGSPWDVVAAADVLYERRNVPQLLELLPRLVDERGVVLLAEPGRPAARAFLEEAAVRFRIEASPPLYRLTLRARTRA